MGCHICPLQTMYQQLNNTPNKPYAPTLKKIIDIPLLHSITVVCYTMWMGQIFKALYLTAFFFIFENFQSCTTLYQSCFTIGTVTRSDVFFAPPGFHLLIKWTKTIQTRDSIRLLKIPSLRASPLCPVRAIKI